VTGEWRCKSGRCNLEWRLSYSFGLDVAWHAALDGNIVVVVNAQPARVEALILEDHGLMEHLHRSVGRMSLSDRIWLIHLLYEDDRVVVPGAVRWSTECAAVMAVEVLVVWNVLPLITCPNVALRRRDMSSEIDGNPVIRVRSNWCRWIWSIDREFEFYEFFSFLKFNEFYEFFFGWKKFAKKIS